MGKVFSVLQPSQAHDALKHPMLEKVVKAHYKMAGFCVGKNIDQIMPLLPKRLFFTLNYI